MHISRKGFQTLYQLLHKCDTWYKSFHAIRADAGFLPFDIILEGDLNFRTIKENTNDFRDDEGHIVLEKFVFHEKFDAWDNTGFCRDACVWPSNNAYIHTLGCCCKHETVDAADVGLHTTKLCAQDSVSLTSLHTRWRKPEKIHLVGGTRSRVHKHIF